MSNPMPSRVPITISSPPNDPTAVETVCKIDPDALWGEFDKFYNINKETIEKCVKTNVRSLALGETVSDIESQIDSLSETTKVVLDGLAALGKIHPIIGVAVVAFYAVISLDMTRRDNDRKVMTIRLEMQNMMCAMFELRHLKHTHVQDSEKDAGKSRLLELIEGITADIKTCGSDLNSYLGQKFGFKLIMSKNFEQRFKTHVENFAKRRTELQNSITMYIAGGVDHANTTITAVSMKLDSVDAKLDRLFEAILRKLDTAQEKEVFRFFEQHGGVENCISKDELFGRLLTLTGDVLPDSEMKAGLTPDKRIQKSREALTDENFEEVLGQNTLRFEKLLAVQNNNHESVLAKLEKQEGYHKDTLSQLDKILLYVHPNTKLDDPEVGRIWENMGLKTTVEAKTFVLTFRDYYQNDHLVPPTPNPTATASPRPLVNYTPGAPSLSVSTNFDQPNLDSTSEDPNTWLLEYIDVAHVGPIVEAVDTDGSGFISVKEINAFARARPKGWSLLQWMVYWAAGWHINIMQYRNKIYDILVQMHELLPSIHPANRFLVNYYLDEPCMDTIEGILRSTKGITGSQQSQLAALAQFYTDAQESALRANLKEVSYVISSEADAALVAGPGRAESWIYPLLYLLLERHLAVMKLSRTQVLNWDELYTHAVSLDSVLAVFEQRMEFLAGIFPQIYQNVDRRFETFAYGMFYTFYKADSELTLAKNTLLKVRAIQSTRELLLAMRNKSKEPAVPRDTTILALKNDPPFEFEDLNIYEFATVKTDSDSVSHPLEGYWLMACHDPQLNFFGGLGLFHFVLSVVPDGSITGFGEARRGKLQLEGTTTPSSKGSLTHSFKLKIITNNDLIVDYFFHGVHNAERDVATGSWDRLDPPSALTPFSMRRTPADVHWFRHNLNLDTETDTSILAKNRWKFAIEATKYRVKTKNFSWEYVQARFEERRLWLFITAAFGYRQLLAEPWDTAVGNLSDKSGPWTSPLLWQISRYQFSRHYTFKIGNEIACDYCGNEILCKRYTCITCINDNMSDQINLCTVKPKCIENVSSKPRHNFFHSPSHTLLHSTSWLHKIHYSGFFTHCRTRSENVKKTFRSLEENRMAKNISKMPTIGNLEYGSKMDEAANVEPLFCVCCEKEVSLPCWICATCVTYDAICLECELKQARVIKSDNRDTMHSHGHYLLRINDSVEVQPSKVDNISLQRELIDIKIGLRSLEQKVTMHLQVEPAAVFGGPPTSTPESRQLAGHLASIDSCIYSLQNHIDARLSSPGTNVSSLQAQAPPLANYTDERFTSFEPQVSSVGTDVLSLESRIGGFFTSLETRVSSLGTDVSSLGNHIDARFAHTDARISALETRLGGLESQLGEILGLLKQVHNQPAR